MVWMRMLHRGLCPVVLLCMAFLLAGTSSYASEREAETGRDSTRLYLCRRRLSLRGDRNDQHERHNEPEQPTHGELLSDPNADPPSE